MSQVIGTQVVAARWCLDRMLSIEPWAIAAAMLVMLIASTLVYVANQAQKPKIDHNRTLLHTKLTFALCLLTVEGMHVSYWAASTIRHAEYVLIARLLSSIYTICTCIALYTEHMYCNKLNFLNFLSFSLATAVLAEVVLMQHSGTNIQLLVIALGLRALLLALGEASKRGIRLIPLGIANDDKPIVWYWKRSFTLWVSSAFAVGNGAIIHERNLPNFQNLPPEFESEHASREFLQAWNAVDQTSKYSLLSACIKALGPKAYLDVIPRCLLLVMYYSVPFLIKRTVQAIAQPDLSFVAAGCLVGGFTMLQFIIIMTQSFCQHVVYEKITLLRSYLFSAIYNKILTLDESILKEKPVMVLISSDFSAIEQAFLDKDQDETWSSVLSVGIGMCILYSLIGPASLLALIPASVAMYFSYLISTRIQQCQVSWMQTVEHRIARTADALQHIAGIKMGGLTNTVAKSLGEMLDLEIDLATVWRQLYALIIGLGEIADGLTPVIAITAGFFWTRGTTAANAPEIFAALSTVNTMALSLCTLSRTYLIQSAALGSLQRIQAFLVHGRIIDNRETPVKSALETRSKSPILTIEICGVSTRRRRGGRALLRKLNVKFPQDKVSMITGSVGCGKSILLKLLIGEEAICEGSIYIDAESVAYCGQVPWVHNRSIRENIIGDNPYSSLWYEAVLFACHLLEDLDKLPHFDDTLAGNGGSNLSTGQRARVAIARALYTGKPILIFDDVFSSIDRKTAEIIFDRLLGEGGVLKGARNTVIMTTNLFEHLVHADFVFHLDPETGLQQVDDITSLTRRGHAAEEFELEPNVDQGSEEDPVNMYPYLEEELEENRAVRQERNSFFLFWWYVQSFGLLRLVVWLFWVMTTSVLERGPLVFVSLWFGADPTNTSYGLTYVGIGCSVVLCGALMSWFFYTYLMSASYKRLHGVLLGRVTGATLSFFSTVDMGVLLNRFSQDMSLISQDVPIDFFRFGMMVFSLSADFAIVGFSSKYGIFPGATYLGLVLLFQIVYQRLSRKLLDLNMGAKSPLFALFSETSTGIQHIRAFQWTQRYKLRIITLLNDSQKHYYNMLCTQQWLRFAGGVSALVASSFVLVIAFVVEGSISQATVGLIMVNLQRYIRTSSVQFLYQDKLDTSIGTVEELKTFAQTTPSEMDRIQNPIKVEELANWPIRGKVELRHMSAKYNAKDRQSPRILKGVSLVARPGEKIGISGRTGSGKTTLLMSILHLLDYTGSILIDGIEIRRIPLEVLRSRITTIPQETVELPGTVRHNLYPYSDELAICSRTPRIVNMVGAAEPLGSPLADSLMIRVLERLGIWPHIQSFGGLDADLLSLHLSQGQKQLLGVARAIIHHLRTDSRIALIDEMTSQVDYETDALVQTVITDMFSDCTMLVIAHRKETIAHMDRLIEIGNGRIIVPTQRK